MDSQVNASVVISTNMSHYIRQTLQEANERLFSVRNISLRLLKDCPENIPILVEWMYEEWRHYDATLTREKLSASFNNRLNDDKMPFTIVAERNAQPIGMIALKETGEPEFSSHYGTSPWLGSLHVLPEERNQGIGQTLVRVLNSIAVRLGHQKVLVYTSNPNNVTWYLKRGAHVIDKQIFRGHPITIMAFDHLLSIS